MDHRERRDVTIKAGTRRQKLATTIYRIMLIVFQILQNECVWVKPTKTLEYSKPHGVPQYRSPAIIKTRERGAKRNDESVDEYPTFMEKRHDQGPSQYTSNDFLRQYYPSLKEKAIESYVDYSPRAGGRMLND